MCSLCVHIYACERERRERDKEKGGRSWREKNVDLVGGWAEYGLKDPELPWHCQIQYCLKIYLTSRILIQMERSLREVSFNLLVASFN